MLKRVENKNATRGYKKIVGSIRKNIYTFQKFTNRFFCVGFALQVG